MPARITRLIVVYPLNLGFPIVFKVYEYTLQETFPDIHIVAEKAWELDNLKLAGQHYAPGATAAEDTLMMGNWIDVFVIDVDGKRYLAVPTRTGWLIVDEQAKKTWITGEEVPDTETRRKIYEMLKAVKTSEWMKYTPRAQLILA